MNDDESKKAGYHHGNLREALIQGGLSLLAREGLAGFSLRALAQELGVSHAAPYRHFASREELLTEIVVESRGRFAQALRLSVEHSEAQGREKLFVLGEAYVRFFLDNPEILSLFNILPGQLVAEGEGLKRIFGGGSDSDPEGAESRLMNDPAFMVLRQTASVFLNSFPGLSERDVLLGYWAKVHGLASILVSEPNYFAPETLESGLERVIRQAF
jgi:AcrR family transcriptional regulator